MGYDVRPAPVIRAQGVDRRARIPPLKRADVLGVRPGEGVDHLVVVAHREQVVQGQGEQPEHQELHGGEVLDLVHEDRIEAVLVDPTRNGMLQEDFHGPEQLLVKGHQGFRVHPAIHFIAYPARLVTIEPFDLDTGVVPAEGNQRSPEP